MQITANIAYLPVSPDRRENPFYLDFLEIKRLQRRAGSIILEMPNLSANIKTILINLIL